MILLYVFVALTTIASGIHQKGVVTPMNRQVLRPQIPRLPQPAATATQFQHGAGTLHRLSESPQIRRMYIYEPFPIPQVRPPNVKYKVPATHSGTMPNNINSVAKKEITESSRQYYQVPKPLIRVRRPLHGSQHINVHQTNVTSHGRHMTNLRSTITTPLFPKPTLHNETKNKHYTKYELMQNKLMGILKSILNPLQSMISRSHQKSGQQTASQRQLVKDAKALSNLLAKLKQGDQSLLMRRLRITPPNINQHIQRTDILAQKQRQQRLAQQRQQRLAQQRQQRLAQQRQQRLAQQRQRQQWHQQNQRQVWQGWQQQQWQQRQLWQRQRQQQKPQQQQQRQQQPQPRQRQQHRYQIQQKQPQQYHQKQHRTDQHQQQQQHLQRRQQRQQRQQRQHNIVSRSLPLSQEGNSKGYGQNKPPQLFYQLWSWLLAYTQQRARQLLRQIHGTNEPTSSIPRSNINQFSKMFGFDIIRNLTISNSTL